MFARIGTLLFLFVLFPQAVHAAGSKKGKAQVSFHLQADLGDSPKMVYPMMVSGKRMNFKRMPEIQTTDVAGYRALPSKKHEGIYDIVLLLKPHASKRLQNITNINRGLYMASQLNGRTGEAMLIDAQINDGSLVIWGVANAEDLQTLAKAFKGTVDVE
ncbi:MAG: hypothetical protein ACO3SO_02870 [Luteolibacter sp.]